MVALVIFTGAAMALYALFNTNLIALTRAHDVSRQTPAVRHAIEHLASINPREAGDGRIELDGLDVVWSATLVQPPRQSQTLTGGRGYYEIGLYEIEFTRIGILKRQYTLVEKYRMGWSAWFER